MNNAHRKLAGSCILALCAVALTGAWYCASSDTKDNDRTHEARGEFVPRHEQILNPVPTVEATPVAAPEPVQEVPSPPPPSTNVERLAVQVAELSDAVARLEQTTRNLEERLARSMRPLPTGDRTEAGLAGKKAELDAQARRFQTAATELQRFAARFGIVLDERVLTDQTFSTPLDKQPGFNELRLAATSSLRVLQAVERKFAADLMERASFQ